jgi:tetratricopeptide (TPR) repeat protein
MGLLKSKGNDDVDEDKEALKEANSGIRPHIGLLKARLLFDGGYLDQALMIMTQHASENWSRPRDRGEYTYRLARIYDEKKDVPKALQLYQQTIDHCRNETWYFAANSSLHMGYIYETRKEYAKARACFEQVMHYPNTEYKDSLDQKAKASLERIKGK